MSSPLDQEFRSRELADSLRKYLIGINTGGIAVVTALSKSLSWAPTIMCFILGIVFCGVSLFFAQYRALKRRDSAKNKLLSQKLHGTEVAFSGMLCHSCVLMLEQYLV